MEKDKPVDHELCESCRVIPPLQDLRNSYYTLHDTFEEFESCSCSFCHWLYTYIDSKSNFRDSFKQAATQNGPVELFGNLLQPSEREHLQSLTLCSGTESFNLFLVTRFDNPAAKYIWGRIVDPDPCSDRAVSLIKAWVSHCGTKHANCAVAETEIELPTYLVDIGDSELADSSNGPPPRIRLIETTPNQHDRRYIALSYVWGVAAQPVMLTKGTKTQLMDEIPATKLPQTHLDAIRVARWLGIRYLWIDALCIVQDDEKENKMKEISRMHLIYSHSFLTLQACRAASVHDGFLSPRVDTEEASELPYPSPQTADGSRFFIRTKVHFFNDGPTGSRAWCYEETVLSSRILSYTKDEIRFRCMQMSYDDTGRISKPVTKTPHSFLNPKPWYTETGIPKSVWQKDLTMDLLKVWYTTLDLHYTPRLLTHPGDRLIAIGGLMRRYGERIPGAYLAGLWEIDLPWGLLWESWRGKCLIIAEDEVMKASGQISKWRLSMTRPEGQAQKRAPSWSWAALNGAVFHPGMNFRYYTRGTEIGTKRRILATIDEIPRLLAAEKSAKSGLGELHGNGALYITAPLLLLDLVYKDDDEERWEALHGKFMEANKGKFLTVKRRPLALLNSPPNKQQTLWENLPMGYAQLDLSEDEYRPDKVWCLMIVDGRGLTLDAVDEERKIFVRTGCIHATEKLWPEPLSDIPSTSVCII